MREILSKPKSAICFGEILWDNLPSGRMAGGAPMNVAYHLQQLGVNTTMISKVGNDEAGKELVAFISSIGIPAENIQIDEKQHTSEVIAELKNNNEMAYTITYPTAWDFIEWQNNFDAKITAANVFIWGSLAARNEMSRNTLLQLVENAKFRVFDVNLRAPHYDKEIISTFLSKADFVKLNENEIIILGEWFTTQREEKAQVKALMEHFKIDEILITKGAHGGTYYNANETINYQATKVEVVDTVGSGDSFLAAFLSKKLAGEEIATCLNFASKVAGFVTSQKGACPAYNIHSIENKFKA